MASKKASESPVVRGASAAAQPNAVAMVQALADPLEPAGECPVCYEKFTSRSRFLFHLDYSGCIKSQHLHCPRCGNSFASSHFVKCHIINACASRTAESLNGVTQQFLTANLFNQSLSLSSRGIVPLLTPSDPELYMGWGAQLSSQTRLLLANIHAFVLLPPLGPSQYPQSRLLQGAWRELCGRQDNSATGLCCAACLSLSSFSSPGWFHFIDLTQDTMYRTIRTLLAHLKTCPRAYSKTADLLHFSVDDDSLPLKAFVKWFCESHGICKRPAVPAVEPSRQQRQLARDAVARYKEHISFREEIICRDLDHALSSAFVKTRRGSGVLASDLTEVPSSDPLIEYPFYLQLLEHIEIVRITEENAGRHKELLRQKKVDSLVLFQCRFCYGKFCPQESEKLPYVVYTADNNKRMDLLCDLIQLLYHHVPACPEVPNEMKLKIHRVAPLPESEEFREFATYFSRRVLEWVGFVKREIAAIELAASIPASEDVPMWRPVDELVEDNDNLSPMALMPNEATWASDSECRDIEEGFSTSAGDSERGEIEYMIAGGDTDSGCVFPGHNQFHEVTAGFRDEFLSAGNPEERNKIAERVVGEIQKRGGLFLSLDSQGNCRLLSFGEAVHRSRAALQKGSDNDVVEGTAGACDFSGNKRFRVVVAGLREEFMSTTNPEERTRIAQRVVHTIHNRGGSFFSLGEYGCRLLYENEAIERSRVALEKGFLNLLHPHAPAPGHQGVGSKVLEYEFAPRYDVLSGKLRPFELVRLPTSHGVAQSQAPGRLPAVNGATQTRARLPTSKGAAQRQARARLSNSNDAAPSQARVSLPTSNGATPSQARVSLPTSSGASQSPPRKRTCLEAMCQEIVNL